MGSTLPAKTILPGQAGGVVEARVSWGLPRRTGLDGPWFPHGSRLAWCPVSMESPLAEIEIIEFV